MKGIMDTLIDELNKESGEGEPKWERLHSEPKMECGDGKWRTLDGRYAPSKEEGGK